MPYWTSWEEQAKVTPFRSVGVAVQTVHRPQLLVLIYTSKKILRKSPLLTWGDGQQVRKSDLAGSWKEGFLSLSQGRQPWFRKSVWVHVLGSRFLEGVGMTNKSIFLSRSDACLSGKPSFTSIPDYTMLQAWPWARLANNSFCLAALTVMPIVSDMAPADVDE